MIWIRGLPLVYLGPVPRLLFTSVEDQAAVTLPAF